MVTIRTTHHGAGPACGVVTGVGAYPRLALADLERNAKEAARQVGQRPGTPPDPAEENTRPRQRPVEGSSDPDFGIPSKSERWFGQFEVVDVRLTPGPIQHGASGWLAYGTLVWKGKPGQASTGST